MSDIRDKEWQRYILVVVFVFLFINSIVSIEVISLVSNVIRVAHSFYNFFRFFTIFIFIFCFLSIVLIVPLLFIVLPVCWSTDCNLISIISMNPLHRSPKRGINQLFVGVCRPTVCELCINFILSLSIYHYLCV